MESPRYLSNEEILELHERVIGLHGGKPGVRDPAALESCVAQPKTAVFGKEAFPTVFDKAAAYCFYIVRLHPFFDGNKRTGFMAALTFLLDAGVKPTSDEDELFDAIVGITTGDTEVDDLASLFRRSFEPEEPNAS